MRCLRRSLAACTDRAGLVVLRSPGKFFGLAGVRAGFVLERSGAARKVARDTRRMDRQRSRTTCGEAPPSPTSHGKARCARNSRRKARASPVCCRHNVSRHAARRFSRGPTTRVPPRCIASSPCAVSGHGCFQRRPACGSACQAPGRVAAVRASAKRKRSCTSKRRAQADLPSAHLSSAPIKKLHVSPHDPTCPASSRSLAPSWLPALMRRRHTPPSPQLTTPAQPSRSPHRRNA